ncbi:hypothetical protein OROHE_001089 [Orobanche hederae]
MVRVDVCNFKFVPRQTMDGKTSYLPYDIMENILSRLPVKSLLRFKSVCKHWNATISDDPQFAATHLRRSKNSSSSCLVYGDGKTELVDFKDAEIRRFSSVDFPVLGSSSMHILCYCDGLYVLAYEYWLRREIVLWNPSTRSHKNLNNKYEFEERYFTAGMSYDPLLKEYKIVLGDSEKYAVYYCRNNSWSELKEMNKSVNMNADVYENCSAVPWNGSVYWICYSNKEDVHEIVYFDGRDEEFKNLRKLDIRDRRSRLISSMACICSLTESHIG